MSQAEHIIGLLGGVRRAAEILKAPPTTIQSWRDGKFVPARRQQGVIDAAKSAGIKITPADFFTGAAA